MYTVTIYPPVSVKKNRNVTLHFKIEKVSLLGLSSGSRDMVKVGRLTTTTLILDANKTTVYTNFTPPPQEAFLQLARDVNNIDLMTTKLDVMPGFKLSWWYTGADVKPYPKFKDDLGIKNPLNSDFIW